jgi:transposase
VSVTMRQTHAAGERLFVDYPGDGVPVVIDRLTGKIRMAQIFVAVLGASSFTFAKAALGIGRAYCQHRYRCHHLYSGGVCAGASCWVTSL